MCDTRIPGESPSLGTPNPVVSSDTAAAPISVKQMLTPDELVERIVKKGFLVDDREACAAYLLSVNYYRLSAYFLPYKNTDGTYRKDIPFSTICNVYAFDRKLRALITPIIEETELYLHTKLSHYSAEKYGALGYMDKGNYGSKFDESKFLDSIVTCIRENRFTNVVKHHQHKYNNQYPIWVMVEFFSMGRLSYFYSDMKLEDKKAIAKELYSVSYKNLESWLRCLTDLRNRCAHFSRLYFWIFTSIPRLPNDINYAADRRLFSQLIMLKCMYPDAEAWNTNFVIPLSALIEAYEDSIELRHIGFPEDWAELIVC